MIREATIINEAFNRAQSPKSKAWLIIKVWVGLAITIGFAMFIMEETMQVMMFASFNYKNVGDWNGLKSHLVLMKTIDIASEITIRGFGWINPVMYPSYLSYLKANDAYIRSIESELKNHK